MDTTCSSNSTSRSRSRKGAKLFVDSFRAIRNQFRHIYRKCTCSLADTKLPCMGDANNRNLGGKGDLTDDEFRPVSASCRCKTPSSRPGTSNNLDSKMYTSCHHRVEENLRYSHEDYLWIMNRETTEVNLGGILLPSPPPTPVKLSHPDGGDFLRKVIPPPLEYQDGQLFHEQSQFSRPSSATTYRRHRQFCRRSFGLTRTESEASLGILVRDDDRCLQLPTIRTHSAISKFVSSSLPSSRPNSKCGAFTRSKSRGGFSINDCLYRRELHQDSHRRGCAPRRSRTPVSRHSRRDYRHRKAPEIHWKDLPRSISLAFNSGLVESMFIPSWADEVLRKAPFFGTFENVINWTAINLRHERVDLRQSKIEEHRTKVMTQRRSIWHCRCQIGLLKRKLRNSNRNLIDDREQAGDVGSRFQFVYRLNERDNDVNSIGRYFDTEEKRLVAIKIVGDRQPSDLSEQVQLKLGAWREIHALMRMDHVNVVRMLSYFENLGKMHIIMEPCDHSLRCEMAFAGNGADPVKARNVIAQILAGLNYCHQKNCLHRNLSPDNILVTVSGVVKIADFSKALFLRESFHSPCLPADIRYGAPELLALDSKYNVSADVWSAGCILLEMLRGRLIWNGSTAEEQLAVIHKSVGPLLPQHAAVAMIMIGGKNSCRHRIAKRMQDLIPGFSEAVYEFLENCLHVNPAKRKSCKELLNHPFIKLESAPKDQQQDQSDLEPPLSATACEEISFPKMALWEAPLSTKEPLKISGSIAGDEEKTSTMAENLENIPSPKPILKSSLTAKKPKASVAFCLDLASESLPSLRSQRWSVRPPLPARPADPHLEALYQEPRTVNEELLGVGRKSFWQNLKQLSHSTPHSTFVADCSPITRKGSQLRRAVGREPLSENTPNYSAAMTTGAELAKPGSAGQMNEETANLVMDLPSGPRSRLQYLLGVLPRANWNSVNLHTNLLKTAAKKTPKAFSAHIEQLVSVLLEQISNSKSKVAGPAIRILNNICEYKSNLFEPEAERIIEAMLNKLGGPSFIEKECNEVLRHIAQTLAPSKAIHTFVKLGGNHRVPAARQSTICFVEEAVKKLDLISELGLPGEQTAPQRRLSNAVFDIATRFLKDTSAQTRLLARNIYQHLMRHPGFWYLYQSTLPEEKRQWVNRLLEEMRRYPPPAAAAEKRNLNSINNRQLNKPLSLV